MTAPYLYQTIHLHDRRPRHLTDHVEVLDAAARRCFGIAYAPHIAQLAQHIEAIAVRERFPARQSAFVRLEVYADGSQRLESAGVSLYTGYALRSLRPMGSTLTYGTLFPDEPTWAREAEAQLARTYVLQRAEEYARTHAEASTSAVAVRCDPAGHCITADNAPLFAVHGRTVWTPPACRSVERDLGIEAALAAGFEIAEAPVEAAALGSFDEVFYVDHRGVTSLLSCDGHPYMDLAAVRVAAAMEGLFRKV